MTVILDPFALCSHACRALCTAAPPLWQKGEARQRFNIKRKPSNLTLSDIFIVAPLDSSGSLPPLKKRGFELATFPWAKGKAVIKFAHVLDVRAFFMRETLRAVLQNSQQMHRSLRTATDILLMKHTRFIPQQLNLPRCKPPDGN